MNTCSVSRISAEPINPTPYRLLVVMVCLLLAFASMLLGFAVAAPFVDSDASTLEFFLNALSVSFMPIIVTLVFGFQMLLKSDDELISDALEFDPMNNVDDPNLTPMRAGRLLAAITVPGLCGLAYALATHSTAGWLWAAASVVLLLMLACGIKAYAIRCRWWR